MGAVIPVLLLLFAIALLLRVDVFVTIVWFLLGVYILSRLWARRASGKLEVQRRFVNRGFTGDEVPVELVIRNRGRLPVPWVEISESIPLELRGAPFPTQVVTLGPRAERHISYTLYCRHRGYYRPGPLRMETGDLLGMEEESIDEHEPRPFIVYPRIVPLEQLGLPTRSALVSLPAPTPLFEDPTRIMGVRQYQPGDSPRRIHWTASARAGELLVKQYQPAIARETLICLDLYLRSYQLYRWNDAMEQAIVVAASLAHHMIVQEGLPAGLATDGDDPPAGGKRRITIPPGPERAHLMDILEVLARVQGVPGEEFADLLHAESVRLRWGSTVVVISGRITPQVAETVLQMKRRGHAVAVILIQPPFARDSLEGRLAGVRVHHVWTDQDLAMLS